MSNREKEKDIHRGKKREEKNRVEIIQSREDKRETERVTKTLVMVE